MLSKCKSIYESARETNPKLIIAQYYDSLIREIDIFTEERLVQLSDDQVIETSMVKQLPKELKRTKESSKLPKELRNDFNQDDLNLDTVKYDENLWSYYGEEKQLPDEHNYLYGFDVSSNLMRMNQNKKTPPMKARDYYNQARDEMIVELNKLQDEAFEKYNKIKDDLKKDTTLSNEQQIELLRSQLFANKFAFIVEYDYEYTDKEFVDDHEDEDGKDEDEEEAEKENHKRFKLCHLIVVDFYLNENARLLMR